jgi:hypothetical protein
MWNGSPDGVVDLNPLGFYESTAMGVSGDTQVGWGQPAALGYESHHPLLWHNSAESVVDLLPAGYGYSEAFATSNGSQVGYAILGGSQHAMLWNGTATSKVDLHPNSWSTSFAIAVSSGTQVGYVRGGNGTPVHAALWKGNAASFVDLNPAGVSNSVVLATSGDIQVGYGIGSSSSFDHAMLWSGTAASAIDLHQFLSGLGKNLPSSHATSMAPDGTIFGYAGGTSPGNQFAIAWTPIVESGIPGDYNNDNEVNAADYLIWRKKNGSTFPLVNEPSATTPGQVTPEDYTAWRARFGNNTGSGASQEFIAVPESSSAVLVMLLGLALQIQTCADRSPRRKQGI